MTPPLIYSAPAGLQCQGFIPIKTQETECCELLFVGRKPACVALFTCFMYQLVIQWGSIKELYDHQRLRWQTLMEENDFRILKRQYPTMQCNHFSPGVFHVDLLFICKLIKLFINIFVCPFTKYFSYYMCLVCLLTMTNTYFTSGKEVAS